MWGYIIFCLVFLALGILIAVYAKWIIELNYDINKDVDENLDKIVKLPHLSNIWSPYSSRVKFFVLLARIFGIFIAIGSALGLYVVISNSIP